MHTAECDKLGGVSGGARIFTGGAWCARSVCLVVYSIGVYVFLSASFLVSLSIVWLYVLVRQSMCILFVCQCCVGAACEFLAWGREASAREAVPHGHVVALSKLVRVEMEHHSPMQEPHKPIAKILSL
jgi:hypothetical protein